LEVHACIIRLSGRFNNCFVARIGWHGCVSLPGSTAEIRTAVNISTSRGLGGMDRPNFRGNGRRRDGPIIVGRWESGACWRL